MSCVHQLPVVVGADSRRPRRTQAHVETLWTTRRRRAVTGALRDGLGQQPATCRHGRPDQCSNRRPNDTFPAAANVVIPIFTVVYTTSRAFIHKPTTPITAVMR